MYKDVYTRQAAKDAKLIEQAGLRPKVDELLRVVRQNPYQNPPPYEKLVGVSDTYSRRITKTHRFVYQVLQNTENLNDDAGEPYKGIIKVIRMWTHYE